MATRKVKNAIDLTTNELIYFKGHAQATYMSDGRTVEDAIIGSSGGTDADLSKYATKDEVNAKYTKPTSGIPKSDLTSSVQTSLSKADTALQSYTEQYKGTVTGVKVNGTTKNPSNGVVDLGTVITSHQDISGKQDKLVSGTNIKTINNTSILGSGNISITGGSGTITGVSANGTSIATSGVANIPAASTSVYGVTKLTSSTSSTSTTLAATASAVKSAYDLANSYKGTVTSVKLNGTTYSPTSGVVDLGTISGGSSDANVQAVDTGDVLDDVNVSYATTAYVDGLIGDINSVLESIINGNETNEVYVNIVESYLAAPVPKETIYDVICVLSKPLDVKQTATLYYLDGDNQPQTLSLVVESGQTEFVFEQVMINHIEPDMYSVVIGEIEEEDANGIKVTLRSNFKFKYVYS